MSFLLTCPHCGVREVADFAFGGEVNPRPRQIAHATASSCEYNYFRRNVAGVQREWWYHRSGCRTWFLAERDTRTNEVLRVGLPGELRAMSRLAPQPGERDRPRQDDHVHASTASRSRVSQGDTIGSALYAPGRRTFSRSFKYHRRRGLMCCAGNCPNCLVAVDGAPGVRACTEPARQRRARRAPQRTPESRARRDVDHRRDRRTVHAARLLLQDVHASAAAVAALREGAAQRRRARAAAAQHRPSASGGPSTAAGTLTCSSSAAASPGSRAAIAAAELGADVVLADEGAEPGGRLLWEGGHERAARAAARARDGRGRAARQRARARALRRPRARLAGRHAAPGRARATRSSRPARSSSRSCSRATTCRA